MRISDIVKITGLSSSAIRYYEKMGIICNIDKDQSGIRKYSEEDVRWIQFISGCRKAKIPLKKLSQFAKLYYDGVKTIDDIINLLADHREQLERNMEELTTALDYVDKQIGFYSDKKSNTKRKKIRLYSDR